MSVTFQERPNNTRAQVREYLATALELVEELDTPSDLRAACFTEAVKLVSGKQVLTLQAAPPVVPVAALPGLRQ